MPVTVARYDFPYQAHIARAKLDSEGIPAFVADEHTINMQWLYSNAMGGVKLQVPESFAEAAREVLAREEAQVAPAAEVEGPRCQHCGSTRTALRQRGRRWAFLSWLVLELPLFPVRRRYHCLDCGADSGASEGTE